MDNIDLEMKKVQLERERLMLERELSNKLLKQQVSGITKTFVRTLAKSVIPPKELVRFLSRWWWAGVVVAVAGLSIYAIKIWIDQSEKARLELETQMFIEAKCKHLPKSERLPSDADIQDRYIAMTRGNEITICQLGALAEISEQRKSEK